MLDNRNECRDVVVCSRKLAVSTSSSHHGTSISGSECRLAACTKTGLGDSGKAVGEKQKTEADERS
ncbi:hypothetical protein CT0861_13265, partial [Colletotrichum tofieldiae]